MYGRKKWTICMAFSTVLGSVLMLFAQNYTMFAVMYFITSGSAYYLSSIVLVLYTEIIPSVRRPLTAMIIQVGITLGQLAFCGAAWILKDWFYTQLAVVFAGLPILLFAWYILESPVWLTVKGRLPEAEENLIKMARRNGQINDDTKEKSDVWLNKLVEKQNAQRKADSGKITDLFKNRVIVRYTCNMIIVSSFTIFCTFGALLNVESFGAGLYLDYSILQGVVLLCTPLVFIVVKKVSVKKFQIFGLVFTSLLHILYTLLRVYPLGRMVIPLLTLTITIPMTVFNQAYTAELFPATVRVIGQSLVVAVSKLFQAASPFVKDLGERTETYVPFILFSSMSLIGAISFFFLPDTRNKALVHTVQDLVEKKTDEGNQACYTITT